VMGACLQIPFTSTKGMRLLTLAISLQCDKDVTGLDGLMLNRVILRSTGS